MKPANNAPVYAGMYRELTEIARAHGYAMAVHGSMIRDFDLICIPWTHNPSTPHEVVTAFSKCFHLAGRIPEPTIKEHGRLAYSLNFSFADCYIDISFMPTKEGV